MSDRRKWAFLVLVTFFGVIAASTLFLSETPASLQFLGYGTDGAGILLLSNQTEHELEFYRPEIEVREAGATTMYVQNYTIAPRRLERHEAIILRVDLPEGRFKWSATVQGILESKMRDHVEALLRRLGIKHEFSDTGFRTSVAVPESNFRSATNVVLSPTGVLEVIRRRQSNMGRRR